MFIALFLCSCAGSGNIVSVVTSPAYQELELKNVKILACINPKGIYIENKLLVKELGEGNPDQVYQSFFKSVFVNSVKRYSFNNSVTYETFSIDSLSDVIRFSPTADVSSPIHLPKTGADFQKDSVQFIIFIDSLRAYSGSGVGFMPGVWLYSQDNFSHECKFFIWDNLKKRVVSYGLVAGREPVPFLVPRKNEWTNSLIKMTREIMRKTPFYNWKGE